MAQPRLVAKREQAGLTQRELGDEIDVDPASVSRLENQLRRGDKPSCPGHLKAACEALDLEPKRAGEMVRVEVSIREDNPGE